MFLNALFSLKKQLWSPLRQTSAESTQHFQQLWVSSCSRRSDSVLLTVGLRRVYFCHPLTLDKGKQLLVYHLKTLKSASTNLSCGVFWQFLCIPVCVQMKAKVRHRLPSATRDVAVWIDWGVLIHQLIGVLRGELVGSACVTSGFGNCSVCLNRLFRAFSVSSSFCTFDLVGESGSTGRISSGVSRRSAQTSAPCASALWTGIGWTEFVPLGGFLFGNRIHWWVFSTTVHQNHQEWLQRFESTAAESLVAQSNQTSGNSEVKRKTAKHHSFKYLKV